MEARMTVKRQEPEKIRPDISRRQFIGAAAAATAGVAMWGCGGAPADAPAVIIPGAMPNSNFNGVQIGTISYSFRSMPDQSAEAILGYLVESGVNSVELMGNPILQFAGQPTSDAPNQNAIDQMTDPAEREAAQRARDAYMVELRQWRASPPMERFAELRRMYNDAGVTIHLAKFSPGGDPEYADFAFRAAHALGAKGVTNEIGEDAARAMGPAAVTHGLLAVMHNHGQPSDEEFPGFQHFLDISPGVSLNFDFGHFFGYTGESPVSTIESLHDRITSFHMKDKAAPEIYGQSGPNMPWGEGGTPIAEILRLVQREGWPIHCDIELEYPVPEGSNAVEEVKKCVEFCRDVLA